MIIKQKRISNLSKFRGISEGKRIRVGVRLLGKNTKKVLGLGFTEELKIGERLLPCPIGPSTRKNANGYDIIHREMEKETCYRMIEWSWEQWAGRGQTVTMTDSRQVPYDRYPRTHVAPLSIEFQIAPFDDIKILVSDVLVVDTQNEKRIVQAVNVLLEAFEECEIFNEDSTPIIINHVVRLNWEVLPVGEFPWNVQGERIKPFIKTAKHGNQPVIEKRLETINNFNPSFTAIGRAGFTGYLVFGFPQSNLYVLESVYVNNATYILDKNWEEISKLSKADILNNALHKDRIIHNDSWYTNIRKKLS